MKNKNNKLTYISLFSSAGIGCFGFKKAGFDCVATCELLEKRLNIQKANNKCKSKDAYISGDITKIETIKKLNEQVKKYNNNIDVIVSTPPCQGMSIVNQKKKDETKRNSLVVHSIKIISEIKPKIFIFENVLRFLKTICTSMDGTNKLIEKEIFDTLGKDYSISHKIMNFKNYGGNSSRTRTLVIGVRVDCLNKITPFEIFPNYTEEKKLKKIIGNFKQLNQMNEFDKKNPLHHFKSYDIKFLPWISSLKEGQSAFDNEINANKPHSFVNNKLKFYKNGFGDKYKRQFWNKVAPCIHTANDCLASQNTIHPRDNRVFSIAELMQMMAIPKEFKWSKIKISQLKSKEEVLSWLNKNQSNIRKCIGEAVPTGVFFRIANNISKLLCKKDNFYDASLDFEKNNFRKEKDAAFYTSRSLLSHIYNILPDFKKKEISILEPSCGSGNFLIPLIKKYSHYDKINIILVDINKNALEHIKKNIKLLNIPKKFKIKYINEDFTKLKINNKFDLVIGNPPFKVIKDKKNKFKNLFELFWLQSFNFSNNVIFVNPKYIISSPCYSKIRSILSKLNINKIIDFGELGFIGVKIETILISISGLKNDFVEVKSIPKNIVINQKKNYIFDSEMPYWILYRNNLFDAVFQKMNRDIFKMSKNYEISNSILFKEKTDDSIWVVRSKNININKPSLDHIEGYDRYAKKSNIMSTKFYSNIIKTNQELFLIPTLTYYPRIIRMPKNIFVNGSVIVVQIKKNDIKFNDNDINYYYSNEFRLFYNIAFNYSTRTLNIDSNTIKFFGVIR